MKPWRASPKRARRSGPDVGIAIDLHGRVHRPMAKALLRELEPFHPLFVEEPVLPEHLHCLPQIAAGLAWRHDDGSVAES